MSIIDNVVGAVTPSENNEPRAKARAVASSGEWLPAVEHHEQIETAFAQVKITTEVTARGKSLKECTLVRTDHPVAKEATQYPASARADEKGHATMAYTEQAVAKLEMGLLEDLPPMSQECPDKFVHIKGAVAHHEYENEGIGFWI